jgi:hypothetical protein
MTEQENQDRTGRNRTPRTGHPEQQPKTSPNMAAKMGQIGQQKQNRTVRTRQPEEDCQGRIFNTGRQGQDSQNRTDMDRRQKRTALIARTG